MQDGNRRRFRASHGERDPEDALEMSRHLDAAGRRADGYVRAHPRQVAEVMTPDPFTMDEDSLPEHVVGAWSRSISSAGTIPAGLEWLGTGTRAPISSDSVREAPTHMLATSRRHASFVTT